ncbi:MAG: hypothetical protein Q9220_000707 [cf. Caloplaca sp. 1 TL-2023]
MAVWPPVARQDLQAPDPGDSAYSPRLVAAPAYHSASILPHGRLFEGFQGDIATLTIHIPVICLQGTAAQVEASLQSLPVKKKFQGYVSFENQLRSVHMGILSLLDPLESKMVPVPRDLSPSQVKLLVTAALGPTELTVFDAQILSAIDGPGTHCTKAVWYDALLPESLVNTTRNKTEHSQRRRMWDTAFTPQALEGYNKKIVSYSQRLERKVANSVGQAVNASSLLYQFSFDLMGDFAFARHADEDDSLNEQWYSAIAALHKGMGLLGPLSPVPWLLHIGISLPLLSIVQDWNEMIAFCKSCMDDRMKVRTQAGFVPAILRVAIRLTVIPAAS